MLLFYKLDSGKRQHAFNCIILKNEIEKGFHLPVYLENIDFDIYISYHKEEDITLIKINI